MFLLKNNIWHCFFVVLTGVLVHCDDYSVHILNNGPIVRGATINFTAVLYDGNDIAPEARYIFSWNDNAIPEHSTKINTNSPIVTWSVTYGRDYPPGPYEVQVVVEKIMFVDLIHFVITSERSNFEITDYLIGQLIIKQNNTLRTTKYVSTSEPVVNIVNLTEPDNRFISNATTVTTYWFIDCVYYGPTINAQFSHMFPISDEDHSIDALMIVDFTPPPPPTTTSKPTTTTIKPTSTTPAPNITTTPPTSTTAVTVKKNLQKRSVPEIREQKIMINLNGSLVRYNGSFPYVCNGTVATDDKKIYGYFTRNIVTKAPIRNVSVTGNNWLQHGEILTLNVACDGSPSLRYCVQFKKGSYNATGNETCGIFLSLDSCGFLIQRYLGDSMDHTVIIIIQNDVTKIVKTVGITVYKVKKQAQLSIIVVPVAFSLVAVVLIVFGVAYYLQNRRRFLIEVADFNFGPDSSDMEYKTFAERLQESFLKGFTRAPSTEDSEVPNWPSNASQKYGSMT